MAIDLHTDSDPVARLHESRQEIFALGRVLQGDRGVDLGGDTGSGFPRSRIMRALMGRHRGLLGGAAVALLVAKPRLVFKAVQWAAMQPLVRRYVMPFLIRRF